MQLSRDLFASDLFAAMRVGATSTSSSSATYATSVDGLKALGLWLAKEFPRIMWLIILFRVAGYCIKNYYLINRHAVKRTTTYAGKHAAFSAELEAAEKLKKSS
jgi:hypothetical protein